MIAVCLFTSNEMFEFLLKIVSIFIPKQDTNQLFDWSEFPPMKVIGWIVNDYFDCNQLFLFWKNV